MTLSIHQISVPAMVRTLNALSDVLAKGQADVDAGRLAEAELLEARLAPDMFTLPRQVQIACDMARGGAARLAGREPEPVADTETTLAELRERIAKTVDGLQAVTEADLNGAEDRPVVLKLRNGTELPFADGPSYLLGFVMPNLYFHAATAYGLLRHKGVALTKKDFVGAI